MGLDEGFLSLLTHRVLWEQAQGLDQWGNQIHANPTTLLAFVSSQVSTFGAEDGHGKQDPQSSSQYQIITDFVGIKVGDRMTVQGNTVWVTNVDTPVDEFGGDLMHTVTATNAPKG